MTPDCNKRGQFFNKKKHAYFTIQYVLCGNLCVCGLSVIITKNIFYNVIKNILCWRSGIIHYAYSFEILDIHYDYKCIGSGLYFFIQYFLLTTIFYIIFVLKNTNNQLII